MSTITYTFKNGKVEGITGKASKDGVVYSMKETSASWHLSTGDSVKIELKWSKKDFPTYEEWKSMLVDEGYTVE